MDRVGRANGESSGNVHVSSSRRNIHRAILDFAVIVPSIHLMKRQLQFCLRTCVCSFGWVVKINLKKHEPGDFLWNFWYYLYGVRWFVEVDLKKHDPGNSLSNSRYHLYKVRWFVEIDLNRHESRDFVWYFSISIVRSYILHARNNICDILSFYYNFPFVSFHRE